MTGKKKASVLEGTWELAKGAWESAKSKHSPYSKMDLFVDVATGGVDNIRDEVETHERFKKLMQPRPKGSSQRKL